MRAAILVHSMIRPGNLYPHLSKSWAGASLISLADMNRYMVELARAGHGRTHPRSDGANSYITLMVTIGGTGKATLPPTTYTHALINRLQPYYVPFGHILDFRSPAPPRSDSARGSSYSTLCI